MELPTRDELVADALKGVEAIRSAAPVIEDFFPQYRDAIEFALKMTFEALVGARDALAGSDQSQREKQGQAIAEAVQNLAALEFGS